MHKLWNFTVIILVFVVLAASIIFTSLCIMDKNEPESVKEELLSGSALRSMMNEAKWSPAQGNIYAEKYPTYAWLFDGSFVTFKEDN